MTPLIRDRYETVASVGRGGQGEVLRALDRDHDRTVAVKVRRVASDAELGAFRAEARILLGLRPHPNLPTVREDFVIGEDAYLVMDWIEGRNLRDLLSTEGRPGLPADRVVTLLAQAAEALDHLHDHEPAIVHGDVKPSNIVLSEEGSAVLVDFGMSRRGDTAGDTGTTAEYAAPEASAGEATPASDVYGLAATAYTLLTGSPPRADETPPIQGLNDTVQRNVMRALRRGLATDPARRPPSATALIESVRAALGPMTLADAARLRRARRRWLAVLLAGVVVLAGGAARLLTRSHAERVVAVRVGSNPSGVAVNPQTARVYVANAGGKSVSVVDPRSGRVVATVPLHSRPQGIAVIPRANRIYVGNADATVTVIAGESNRIVATIPVAGRPVGIAVNPRNSRAYVAGANSTVSVVDGAAGRLVATIAIGSKPQGIAVNPDTSRVYVSGTEPDTVAVVDGKTDRLVATVKMEGSPCGIGVDHKRNLVYVAERDGGKVAVLDGVTNVIVGAGPGGVRPCGLAVNAQSNHAFVAAGDLTELREVGWSRDRDVFPVYNIDGGARTDALFPHEVAVDPQLGRVYVVDRANDRILILDEARL